MIWANLLGSAHISTFANSARPLTMLGFRGTIAPRLAHLKNRRYGRCLLMSRPFHVTSIHGGQLMAVRKVSPVTQLVTAIFTTLLAPIVASVVSAMIKDDMNNAAHIEPFPPAAHQTVVRFQAPTSPAVTLLPPVAGDSSRRTQDEFGPSR